MVEASIPPSDKLKQEEERLILREEKSLLIHELPHLHGWKWYTWAREFFESTNRQNFLCAANQISKSSTQIRKCIHWATAQSKRANYTVFPDQRILSRLRAKLTHGV